MDPAFFIDVVEVAHGALEGLLAQVSGMALQAREEPNTTSVSATFISAGGTGTIIFSSWHPKNPARMKTSPRKIEFILLCIILSHGKSPRLKLS
nr:hypothetical protein [Desulfobacula sp.]